MPRQIVFGLIAGAIAAMAARADDGGPTTRHALLVGCIVYSGLPPKYHPSGSGNDVRLTVGMLKDRFRFGDDEMVVLMHQDDPARRPTRANIVRAFEGLIGRVGARDTVFILLAGHGSQRPDDDPDDREVDGLDEVSLPNARLWALRNPGTCCAGPTRPRTTG